MLWRRLNKFYNTRLFKKRLTKWRKYEDLEFATATLGGQEGYGKQYIFKQHRKSRDKYAIYIVRRERRKNVKPLITIPPEIEKAWYDLAGLLGKPYLLKFMEYSHTRLDKRNMNAIMDLKEGRTDVNYSKAKRTTQEETRGEGWENEVREVESFKFRQMLPSTILEPTKRASFESSRRTSSSYI